MKLHTKSDFTALMHRFLDPLLPLYSEGGARLHLGDIGVTYPGRTIEMEAFSRPLWALAPFWTGGGRADDFLRIYRKGLASGTVQGRGGEGFLVNAYPNTNLYDPNTVIPAVRYDVPVGTSVFTTTVESRHE